MEGKSWFRKARRRKQSVHPKPLVKSVVVVISGREPGNEIIKGVGGKRETRS